MIEFIVGALVGMAIGGLAVFKMYDDSFSKFIEKKFEEEHQNKQ